MVFNIAYNDDHVVSPVKASPVAPVGERCDDQSTCVTQVLIGISHGGGDHLDLDQILDEVVA